MNTTLQDLEEELTAIDQEIGGESALGLLRDREIRNSRSRRKLALEREIARLKGHEYAEEIMLDWIPGFDWYALGGFGIDAVLICGLEGEPPRSAVLTFKSTAAMQIGGLNDEVIEGHRLYGKGLDVSGAFFVRNSVWLGELRKGMREHPAFDQEHWDSMQHFLFRDKGGDFECVAAGYCFEFVSKSAAQIRMELAKVLGG